MSVDLLAPLALETAGDCAESYVSAPLVTADLLALVAVPPDTGAGLVQLVIAPRSFAQPRSLSDRLPPEPIPPPPWQRADGSPA